MMQSAFKPVRVLLPIVGEVSAWMVNEVQDKLLLKTFDEVLSVAILCDAMFPQPLNMAL